MRNIFVAIAVLLFSLPVFSQHDLQPIEIKQMKWGLDYQIYLKTSNDSSYSLPIEKLFHVLPKDNQFQKPEFTYFPVRFDSAYIAKVRQRYPTEADFTFDLTLTEKEVKTLWSSLSNSLDGGWIHFVNCMVYALETQELDLRSAIMTRPISKWKPNPMTESFKRTHKWKYYLPMGMKEAHKEYKKRKKEKKLEDLQSVPKDWIELFLWTNDSRYEVMKEYNDFRSIAKIDAIKILLGAKYLSTPQINFMKNKILKSTSNYAIRQMPTVLIFDQYESAVSLTLDETGYVIDNMVFKNEEDVSQDEILQRKAIITDYIGLINQENKYQFQKRLKSNYINVLEKAESEKK